MSVTPRVTRWLGSHGWSLDVTATGAIASSRNLTLVVRRGRTRALLKVAATPTDPWSEREGALLASLAGGTGAFSTPRLLHRKPGLLLLSWLDGDTAWTRRRRRPAAGRPDDARAGRALAHLHAGRSACTWPVAGSLSERLLWTSPADYASMSPATLALWRAVQHNQRAERTLARLVTRERSAPHALCHGDFRHANVFVSRGRVGVVDFEQSGLGDPARDLGTWLAEDLAAFLAPRHPREAVSLPTLRARAKAFLGAWETHASDLEAGADLRLRAMAWAGEALLQQAYSVTIHEGAWSEREQHVTASALALLEQPGRWAKHFLGGR